MKSVAVVVALVLVVGGLTWMLTSETNGGDKGEKKDEKVITTKSGLKYVEVKVGEGKEAKPGNQVFVHYTGTLKNGKKFDSSRDRNEPFDFELGAGEVIKGWDEGIAGMKVGGKRKLIIPPELGYRDRAKGSIPANSELHFDVELLQVK